MNQNQSYRADIDGLRALAILPVLLYHARLGCPGGYVGVDIFFVISGYLITSLILKERQEGVFNLAGFWERRIRRIFPALAVMLAATFILGWYMFLPEDFQLMAKSTIAQAVMLSNVFFFRQTLDEGGYFGPVVDTQPLLHTWSLSVEEQFYLFFPALIILAARCRMLLPVVVVTGLGSFVTELWYFKPQFYEPISTVPTVGAFFLLPSRAWELLLGALLAMKRGKFVPDQGARELLGWLGVGMISYAILCYDDKTLYPRVAAVLPCLGAALIIFSNEGKLSQVGRLLSFKPVVFIGLISYSLYLWHWPLLVFEKYPAFIKPGPWQRAAVLAVSFVLAILSWKYVETPFRTRRLFPQRGSLFTFAGVITAVFLALGFWVDSSGGMPARLRPEVNRYAEYRNHYTFRITLTPQEVRSGQLVQLDFTNNNPFELMLWGDSHAMAVAPVINDLCRKYSTHGAFISEHSTVLAAWNSDGKILSKLTNNIPQAVLEVILRQHIKVVIMAIRWNFYTPTPQFKQNLMSTVQSVLKSGARIYIMKDVPHPGFDVPRLAAINAMHSEDLSRLGISVSEYSDLNGPWGETFNQLSKIGATVLDPTSYFINSHGLYGVVKDDQVLYWDDDHLSVEGAALLGPLFEPIFKTNAMRISTSHKE